MKRLWLCLCLCVVVCWLQDAEAQYYSWGADRPMKWSQMRSTKGLVIAPDTAVNLARRTLFYVDRLTDHIGEGFRYGAMSQIPFVVHPENFESNGLVMYLPRRVEFLSTPSEKNYSMLWLKQLVAHEYRHTVQYNNLNRGVFRALGFLVGQHAPTVSLLCMPAWAMEGDAVLAETRMSLSGRGEQPSFTMGYRAWAHRIGLSRRGRKRQNVDRWFCGSYCDYLPDHYELGYQICTYAWDRYGENIWDRVADYGARRPYMLATVHRALRKYYGTSVRQLFEDTFSDLNRLWDSLPKVDEKHQRLVRLDERNYTTYEHPLAVDEHTLVVLKRDFDCTERFLKFDLETGEEQLVARVGRISSRPAYSEGRLWWTEYRPSSLFEERVFSRLCYLDLSDGKPHTMPRLKNVLYPTPSAQGLAWVEYDASGRYTVVENRSGKQERWALPMFSEVHGLAWDDLTRAFYVILTEEDGMSLARIDSEGVERLSEPRYVTLSDLKASQGRLFYGSILSGKDEAHCFNLLERKEYQLTRSEYGAFDPSLSVDRKTLFLTSYDHLGYGLASQAFEEKTQVYGRQTPRNQVNPQRRLPRFFPLDSLRFTAQDSVAFVSKTKTKRYRKSTHLFKVNGWLPVGFDPFEAVDEHRLDLNVGLTLVSQNLLSSAEAFAAYGWNRDEGSIWKLGMRYSGWGVRLECKFNYGGDQIYYRLATPSSDPQDRNMVLQPIGSIDKYYSTQLAAVLPFLFQAGAVTHQLNVSAAWNYSNGMVADMDAIRWEDDRIANIDQIGYKKGLHKCSFGLSYGIHQRMAYRDLLPRWGALLSVGYALNPTLRWFSDLVSVYGHAYLPGVARHHSLKLSAAYQTSIGGFRMPWGARPLNYRSSRLIPRGYTSQAIRSEQYRAFSVDYQMPLWYPEGGIPSLLYVKRIRLNLGADVARFQTYGSQRGAFRDLWSVGGDLIFDFNVLRQPASALATFTFSMFRPKDGSMWITGSLGLPF